MMFKTHLIFGILVGLFLFPYINLNPFIYYPLIIFASIFPDIDSPTSKMSKYSGFIGKIMRIFTKHRGIFHSIWFNVLLSYLIFLFFGEIYAITFALGYFSHLLIDGFTQKGINFFHPLAKLHLSGFIETGSVGETVLFVVLIILVIIKII